MKYIYSFLLLFVFVSLLNAENEDTAVGVEKRNEAVANDPVLRNQRKKRELTDSGYNSERLKSEMHHATLISGNAKEDVPYWVFVPSDECEQLLKKLDEASESSDTYAGTKEEVKEMTKNLRALRKHEAFDVYMVVDNALPSSEVERIRKTFKIKSPMIRFDDLPFFMQYEISCYKGFTPGSKEKVEKYTVHAAIYREPIEFTKYMGPLASLKERITFWGNLYLAKHKYGDRRWKITRAMHGYFMDSGLKEHGIKYVLALIGASISEDSTVVYNAKARTLTVSHMPLGQLENLDKVLKEIPKNYKRKRQ